VSLADRIRSNVAALPVLVTTLGLGLSLALAYLWNEDFWWYLASGRRVLAERWIPDHDTFLYSLGDAGGWVTHSWLWTVLIAGVHAVVGMRGVSVLAALLVGALLIVLYVRGPLDRFGLINGSLAVLVLVAGNQRLLLRTELVGWLLVAVYILLLERGTRATGRTLTAMLLLQWLWANLHGGFYLGILTVLAYVVGGWFAGDARRPPLWLLPALVAVSLVTPSFLRGELGYAFMVLSDHGYLMEWRSTFEDLSLREPWIWIFCVLTGGAAFIGVRTPRRPARLLLLAGWAILGAFALRFVLGLVVVWAILLTLNLHDRGLERAAPRRTALRVVYGVATVVFVLLGLLSAVELWRVRQAFELGQSRETWATLAPLSTAAGAADFIERENAPRPILNDMELGGYLIHRLYPTYRLFIDTRQLDLSLVDRYIALMTTRAGWLEAERRFGFRTVILSNLATVSPLALRAFLLEDPAWQLVFLDAQAAVFVRDPPPTMKRIQDLEPFPVIGREPDRWGTLVARVFLRQDPYALAANLLAVLGDLGRLAELERQATRLLVSRPLDPELLRLRGTARLNDGQAALAVEDLRASSRLRPQDAQTRYLLARALVRVGRAEEALAELDRVLTVDGDHRGALRLRERLVGQSD
jgi:hypothetical protein